MKYKLINKQTGEEHICKKVVIDGWDYYVSDEEPTLSDALNTCYYIFNSVLYKREYSHHKGCKKVIATNNPSIDIPKVVDEVEIMANLYCKEMDRLAEPHDFNSFKYAYNKSQETHPNSDDDMIDFYEWIMEEDPIGSTPEILQLWKEQRTKTLYYE